MRGEYAIINLIHTFNQINTFVQSFITDLRYKLNLNQNTDFKYQTRQTSYLNLIYRHDIHRQLRPAYRPVKYD